MRAARSEQDLLLEQTLERYLRESCTPGQRLASLATADGFSRQHWAFFADIGLLALPFEETDGGIGGTLAEVMTVMRLFGKGLLVEPYLPCVLIAGRLLAQSSDAAQRRQWLGPLIEGTQLAGLAHFERGQRFGNAVTETRLIAGDDGWRLGGAKMLVPVAGSLDVLLVTARDESGSMRICTVSPAAAGVDIRPYRTVDAHTVGDVRFSGVSIGRADILDLPDAASALDHVLDYASAALCAESFGCMRALLDMTVDYAKTRKQFGRPIGSFQVLKHRLVDCYSRCELAESVVQLASDDSNPAWRANLAAAKAFFSGQAIEIGHEAIQIHGAMGLTDELLVSHYHKRVTAISMLFGDRACYVDRYLERAAVAEPGARHSALSFETLLTPAELEFRENVRQFLAEHLSDELRLAVRRQTISYPEKDIAVEWQRRLNAQGWLAPHWPREYGGTGWSAVERFVFEYETALAGAPEQVPMGFRYVGPVIAHFGSDWQKAYFLPRMLASEHYWAQGFSEPGAGSDLAALQTSARLEGDHYVVNGTKMWTTHAHCANWMFCIARTAKSEKPQEGISFFLIAMDSPGITVTPIPLLAVDHEVNLVSLDEVRVPKEHLVGAAGRGWDYVKFLLEFERGGTVFSGRLRRELGEARELINADEALRRDRIFAHRMAGLELRLMALELSEFRLAASMASGAAPGVMGSMAKLLSSELQKDITEAMMHAAGYAGLELEPHRPLHGATAPDFPGLDLEIVAMPRYLNMRVASIYGGSSEIQREIIAKHVLGIR